MPNISQALTPQAGANTSPQSKSSPPQSKSAYQSQSNISNISLKTLQSQDTSIPVPQLGSKPMHFLTIDTPRSPNI
jgi:hypothetical protein